MFDSVVLAILSLPLAGGFTVFDPEPPQPLSNRAALRVKILVIRRITDLEKTDRLIDRGLIKGIAGLVDWESWFKAGLAHFLMARLVYRISSLTARRAIEITTEPRNRTTKAKRVSTIDRLDVERAPAHYNWA